MRIKFLSFIASFFMVSFVITSCLDDDNNIEYSPDATIHAFELDTIGYGKTYKFTIDQIKGEIYNEDSLPMGADTIIDRILIKKIETASNYVTILKEKPNGDGVYEDSVYLNTSDSIDFRKPLKLRVYSTEALATYEARDKSKIYTVSVCIHQQDPDSMQWTKMNGLPVSIAGKQKSILLGNDILVYAGPEVYKGRIDMESSTVSEWKSDHTNLSSTPLSVVNLNGIRYATTTSSNVYSSSDGLTWEEVPILGENVEMLLAAFSDSLSAIITDAGEKYFAKSNGITAWVKHGKVPESFPKNDITSSIYRSSTGIETAILVGTPNETKEYTVPWLSSAKDQNWFDMPTSVGTDTSYPSCPYMKDPSIIHYNDAFYIFGGDFSKVHKSLNGIAWLQAEKKFYIPDKFKDKREKQYSLLKDEKDFIWIIWNDGEVYRGRLNKLGFDKK